MKRIFNILSTFVVLAALAACEAKLPPIVIHPDPVFDKNGVYPVTTVSIYETEETVITVSRVYGLSKEVVMTVGVDEALLEQYNALNGTSYELMPAEYYTIPETVKLDKTVKSIEVPVVMKPKALVAAEGLAKANNYVLPLSITQTSITLDDMGAASQVILLPNVVEPKFEVTVPEVNSTLSFIRGVPFTQDLAINSISNFTTIDPSKVTFTAAPEYVAQYNAANGTNYVLLDSKYYTVNNGVLDAETMNYATNVTFDCSSITSDDVFMLPLMMSSSSYKVAQKLPVCVVVELTTLRMWVVNANDLVVSTGKGEIKVEMNAPIAEKQPVNFKIDNSKVAEYNAAHGTSYLTMDAGKVTINATEITAGEKSVNLSYAVDMAGMEYDAADKYLLPLVLDRTNIFSGTQVEGDVIYVHPYRTLTVEYVKEVWGEEKSNRRSKPGITTAQSFAGFRPSKHPNYPHKYAFQYNEVWADGLIYFDILDETIEGDPTKLKLGNFLDRPYAVWQGYDQIIDEGRSYVDTKTGIVHFDLKVMDNAYKAEGGFPIQVNFVPVN
jgi:hypothetical protein